MAQSRIEAYNGSSAPGITRFPLSKPIFLREGVAGLVNLLSSSNEEQAEQAFAQILAKYLGEAKWEARYKESFEAADGARRMLTMLANKPKLVAEFNRRGCNWVDWNRAEPLNSLSGKAIMVIAGETTCTRVWPLAAQWLSDGIENCRQAHPSGDLTKRLMKHLDSRQNLDSNDVAIRMAFSLACIKDIAFLQQQLIRQRSQSWWRPVAGQWKPVTAALLISGLFVSNELLADRAIQSGAVPELVRLVVAWYSTWTWDHQSAVPTELQAALTGLINAFFKTSRRMKQVAKEQFAECNGLDQLGTMLVKLQPLPLKLQAAMVLQGGCSVSEVRKHIPRDCIAEMGRNPAFEDFTKFLGVPQPSHPAPADNVLVPAMRDLISQNRMPVTCSTRSTHSQQTSRPQDPSNIPAGAIAAAAVTATTADLECAQDRVTRPRNGGFKPRLRNYDGRNGNCNTQAGCDNRVPAPIVNYTISEWRPTSLERSRNGTNDSSATFGTHSCGPRHPVPIERLLQEGNRDAILMTGSGGIGASMQQKPSTYFRGAAEESALPQGRLEITNDVPAPHHANINMSSLAGRLPTSFLPNAAGSRGTSATGYGPPSTSTNSSRLYESPNSSGAGSDSRRPSVSPSASNDPSDCLGNTPLQIGLVPDSSASLGPRLAVVPSSKSAPDCRIHVLPREASPSSCGPRTPSRPEASRHCKPNGGGTLATPDWPRASETTSEGDGSSTTTNSGLAAPLPEALSNAASGSPGLRGDPFKLLSEEMGEDVQSYVTDLPLPDEAEDAAELLLDLCKDADTAMGSAASGEDCWGGGSCNAIPAAAVACGAMVHLERLATGPLSHNRNVIKLWHLCQVANHADAALPLEHAALAYKYVRKLRARNRPRTYAHLLYMMSRNHPGIPGFLVRTGLVAHCGALAESGMKGKLLLHWCRVAAAMVDETYFTQTEQKQAG